MYLTVPGGSGFWPAGRGVTIIVNEFVQPYAYVYVMFSPLPTALAYLRIDAWQLSACVRSEAHKENGGSRALDAHLVHLAKLHAVYRVVNLRAEEAWSEGRTAHQNATSREVACCPRPGQTERSAAAYAVAHNRRIR